MNICSSYKDRNRVWTPELVLEEIRRWREAQRPLYSHHMRKHYQELLAAGIRYFGSWKAAVEAAGIPYEEVRRYRKWSKATIVQTIQKLHRQGVDLSFRAMMLSPYAPMVYAAIRPAYFGSWKNALAAAGLEPEEIYRYRSWTEDEILSEIRRLYRIGADLSSKHMDEVGNSLIATARRRFGSWGEAIRRAGLDYEKIRRRRRWTLDRIVEEILSLQKEGVPLTSTEVRQRYPALFAAACKPRFFGSWRRAVEVALGKAERGWKGRGAQEILRTG
jgi:hypothetical protein